jgi:osmotically-inducible protein OsmY
MTFLKSKFIRAMLICGLATTLLCAPSARAQQTTSNPAGAAVNGPVVSTDRSQTVEHDRLRTSAEHRYNSPAERAKDDMLITEVKSSLAERGISDRYPVEVDCDHGTIQLSGVVASADDARNAAMIAMNTRGVVGVKNKLTWR